MDPFNSNPWIDFGHCTAPDCWCLRSAKHNTCWVYQALVSQQQQLDIRQHAAAGFQTPHASEATSQYCLELTVTHYHCCIQLLLHPTTEFALVMAALAIVVTPLFRRWSDEIVQLQPPVRSSIKAGSAAPAPAPAPISKQSKVGKTRDGQWSLGATPRCLLRTHVAGQAGRQAEATAGAENHSVHQQLPGLFVLLCAT